MHEKIPIIIKKNNEFSDDNFKINYREMKVTSTLILNVHFPVIL